MGRGPRWPVVSTRVWQFGSVFVGLLVLFAGLTAGVTLLTRWIGEERIRRWLGGTTWTAPLKGVAAGAITPFCSFSTVPVLLSLLRSRVRTSTIAAFYLASPVLDPVLLVVLSVLFGIPVAVGYGLVVGVVTVAAAMLAERFQVERLLRHPERLGRATVAAPVAVPAPLPVDGANVRCAPPGDGNDQADAFRPDGPWEGWSVETGQALRMARRELARLLLPLAAASLLAVLVASEVPRDVLVRLAGEGQPAAVPAAAVLGIPLYLPTEALAPLGWALRDAGVGTGPILALVVTAAGLSIPEFSLLSGIVRLRVVVGLIGVVMATAVGAGLLVPLVLIA